MFKYIMAIMLALFMSSVGHAFDYNAIADQATRDLQQREQIQYQQAQQRNAQQLRDWRAQPQFDPRDYTGQQPFNFTGPNGQAQVRRRGYNGAVFCQ